MILVFVICAVYVIQLLIGWVFVLGYFKREEKAIALDIAEVSVVVPYKNEANRIRPLLEKLSELEIPADMQIEFIFINDHSSDGSEKILNEYKISNAVLIDVSEKGKKQAIRSGVYAAKHEFVLTWDADVLPKTNYFVELSRLSAKDMWILPVSLSGSKLIQTLGAIEFSWLQLIGIGTAKMGSPQLCNGANLLFRKSLFLQADASRTDYEIASGDDMFLLQSFIKMKSEISASSREGLVVETFGPASFQTLLQQRKRWAGKMSGLKTGFSVFFGLLLLLFVFLCFSILFLTHHGWIILIPLAIKVLNEYILLMIVRRGKDWVSSIPVIIIHQIWYPIYFLRLLLPVKNSETRWN